MNRQRNRDLQLGVQDAAGAAEEEPGVEGERECGEDRDDVLAERPAPLHQQQGHPADVHQAHGQVEPAHEADAVHVVVVIALLALF